MPMDYQAAPMSSGDHEGFASHRPAPAGPAVVAKRSTPKGVALVGVGCALALGLAFGLWAKPELPRPRPTAPMQPVTGSTGSLDIEINAPALPPVPRANGKLEVLPTDLAMAANRAAEAGQSLPPPPPLPMREPLAAREPFPTREALPTREMAPPRQATPMPAPATVAVPLPARPRAEAPCAGARSLADQMVCQDPRLAAIDRRMTQAYRRAVASGAPPAMLRDDQADWLDVREQAARYSPDAVEAVYRQRIAELEEMADQAPF